MKRNSALLICMLLLMAVSLVAQQPYRAAGEAGARQSANDFSQSTIQGCLIGSEVTSSFALTDEHTGEIYLLQGNDSLLKQNVGHEVMITGTATAIRPSDKKGTIGYISPSEPHRTATSASAGQKTVEFEVMDIKPLANTCAQQTESQKTAIAASQDVVRNNPNATEPKVGYSAQAPQRQSGSRPAAPSGPPEAVPGKTGNEGHAFSATTTATAGQVTPGMQTPAGRAEASGKPVHSGQASAPGAPPTAEQTAQNPAAAERIASSAERAEINNSQHQLGVNAQPNYNLTAQQQTERADQAVGMGNAKNQSELPGATQHPAGRRQEREQRAAEHEKTEPTLIGCLSRSGKSGHEFFLTEQKSGTRYRLDAPRRS